MARGRKKKVADVDSEITVNYFGTIQEEAIRTYLLSDDQDLKNYIYDTYLKDALLKMVESIINTYKLYSAEMQYKELLEDTLSFLHTKIHMFEPDRNKKAYSYFGTIVKRKLLDNRKKETKKKKKTLLYEDVYNSVYEHKDIIDVEYVEDNILIDFFNVIFNNINDYISLHKESMKENDLKVGLAIIQISSNWNTIVEDNSNNKFKKNFVLECIRNITKLNTNDISKSLKFYKNFYKKNKNSFLLEKEEDE